MKLKLTYHRSSGIDVDVVVTTEATATIGDLARELLETDPLTLERTRFGSDVTLDVAPPEGGRRVVMSPDRAIGEVAIASGCTVSVVESGPHAAPGRGGAAATMQILSGPLAGRQIDLPAGSTVIGRDDSADVVIEDEFVSKRHARANVGQTVELVDLNSANGILVDGGVVSRVTVLPGQEVQLGDTRLSFTMIAAAPTFGGGAIVGGAIPFDRSPKVEIRYDQREHARPTVPSEVESQPFPWLMMMAPVVMGTTMFAITRNPLSLMFVAMAPMMMLGNFATTRKRTKRQLANDVAKFEQQLAILEQTLEDEVPREHAVRQSETPPVSAIYAAALAQESLLWTRRPEHWSYLHLRLGTAVLPSRNTIAAAGSTDDGIPEYTQKLAAVEDRYRLIADVPVSDGCLVAGALGIAGEPNVAGDALRSVLVQLTGLHSPAELVVTALASPNEATDLAWLSWLPHTSSPQSPILGTHLADTSATVAGLVAQLEELVDQRLGRAAAEPPEPRGALGRALSATLAGGVVGQESAVQPPPSPVVVVVITEQAPTERSRVVQLSERAASVGIVPIWVASRPEQLPAACRTFLDVRAGLATATAHFVRHGTVVEAVAVEGVSGDHAMRFARALAPLADSGAVVSDASDLPRQVSMVSLLGDELADSSKAVVDRWKQNHSIHQRNVSVPTPLVRTPTLRALVGQVGADAMHLDLRTQGPHALVGGTTGSGKSEFLQAWVLGMAAEHSPDRVTFLFVDYKGGAAFAECVRLPHCVGLVTDLSPHLVRRALSSLRAELRHREHLLNHKKAKDLLELEKRGDPDSPPALILVIDEFAALVGEVPEFVDGVVDIAQRGRSLGIHLIMATQRPAGVIRDNLRANTNLRVALRMADESDSSDVVGTPVAATFDPSIPGRGIAKTGPGRMATFQSAYAGGRTSTDVVAADISIHPLRFGAEDAWIKPDVLATHEPMDPGPTDQVRLVESILSAARLAEIPDPRRPWLGELSGAYDLTLLGPRTDAELIVGVSDLPDEQAQKVVHFCPDVDGNLAVYGTGGSGKTVLLRTLAAGAGVTPRGGPVQVYGLDFAAGGLRMLEALPHVGSIVPGDDSERVIRLLRTLRDVADQRSREYPAANAGSITEFRLLADRPDEPRILLLVDNFPAFRDAYEAGAGRAPWYAVFLQLLGEGRQLGIHVVLTADRPASVPGSVSSSVPRRVVLRLAEESMYMMMDVGSDVLGPSSPPGRAIIDGSEVQIAVLGGSGNVADQSRATDRLASAIERRGRAGAPTIEALPTEVLLDTLPARVGELPLLGIGDEDLQPVGFVPSGTFLVGGGPASGRSNALAVLAKSVRRWDPDAEMIYIGNRRSALPQLLEWDEIVTDVQEISSFAKELAARIAATHDDHHIVVVLESLSDFASSPTDSALVELERAIKRSEHLLIAESETSTWGSSYPIFAEMKSGRRGILLQPETVEGDTILRTSFPRVSRSEFPPGRGFYVAAGRVVRVQLPLA